MDTAKGTGLQVREAVITRIAVVELFGLYSYDLEPRPDSQTPQLVILYGQNGSGKTTLLNLLRHLLSPEVKKGHRSAIAQTRFRRFEVEIGKRTTISAYRSNDSLIGTFTQEVTHDSRMVSSHTFEANSDLKIVTTQQYPPSEVDLYDTLRDLDVSLNHLGDDRRIDPFLTLPDDVEHLWTSEVSTLDFLEHGNRLRRRVPKDRTTHALSQATDWIRAQTLKASTTGSEKAGSNFAEVIKSIAAYGAQSDLPQISASDLRAQLVEIEARNATFTQFGLAPAFEASTLSTSIEGSNTHGLELISRLLKSHLEGISVRLNALQGLRDVVSDFVNNINGFFRHKSLAFDLKEGFLIRSKNGDTLSPEHLSSGEKHLLLVMSHVLSSRDIVTIFVIDEPEISLNVTWQRKLVSALLACMVGTSSQLVLATHSIELLSQYADSVVQLDNE